MLVFALWAYFIPLYTLISLDGVWDIDGSDQRSFTNFQAWTFVDVDVWSVFSHLFLIYDPRSEIREAYDFP